MKQEAEASIVTVDSLDLSEGIFSCFSDFLSQNRAVAPDRRTVCSVTFWCTINHLYGLSRTIQKMRLYGLSIEPF